MKVKSSICDYYQQFPDIHPNIVLKTDILRQSLRITEAARNQFQQMDDLHCKGYHLFSYDMDETMTIEQKVPWTVRLEDGCPIQVRTSRASPYALDFTADGFMIRQDDEIVASNIYFDTKPKWYDMKLEDGTPVAAVVQGYGEETCFLTLNKYCEFWKTEEQCLFCDIVSTLKAQSSKGENPIARKDPKVVADVVRMCFNVDTRFRSIWISGGTILSKYRGEAELDFYCRRLEAIRDAMQGCWYPAFFQIIAYDDAGWKRLRETGVPTVQPDIEVWDKRLFQWICPGKNRLVGRDEWIKRVIRAVDFWGRGAVNPNFVAGIEMAKPYGFESISDAVKSTASGWDFLMSHDVIPRYAVWLIEPGTKLAGQQQPPLEFFLELERAYAELRWKHKFDPPPGTQSRKCYNLSCLWDWEYYHGTGPLSKQYQQARQGVIS